MDLPFITASYIEFATTIARTGLQVARFMRTVRDARSDANATPPELLSLTTGLKLLADNTEFANSSHLQVDQNPPG
ncbi:hypothetical protein Vi05172_g12477 [Venturia inaequalis]|nr:hypothetical protein Vi05172_g12477 [Venturia inaequalis]